MMDTSRHFRLATFLTLIGALVVTHAMLRRLTSWRCIIIIIIYDFHAQLQGTGSRSEVFRYN